MKKGYTWGNTYGVFSCHEMHLDPNIAAVEGIICVLFNISCIAYKISPFSIVGASYFHFIVLCTQPFFNGCTEEAVPIRAGLAPD